ELCQERVEARNVTGCIHPLVSLLEPCEQISVFRAKIDSIGKNRPAHGKIVCWLLSPVQKIPANPLTFGKLFLMKSKERVPVTVLTGFLGAGKTTLLNSLLAQKHGYKCAIIINEFGAISIDNQLVVGADEEILELNNGCLCCRVRGDLVRSLGDLLRKQKRFDDVVIETTGRADPNQ